MAGKNNHPELIDQLVDGIKSLTTSEEWRHYLDLQSRFHRYSFGNILLIDAQRHEATRVAGFNAWRKLNRFVRKGEKAIWILAPMVYKNADAEEGGHDQIIRRFKFVPVFDIAQTDGEELPSSSRRLGGNDQNGLYADLVAVAQSIDFTVQDHEFGGTTNGDCSHFERRIRVETTNSPAQRTKTLAHEIAHALLHEKCDNRLVAELEAESTAFVVCHVLGLDTSFYSFGYVASWAGGAEQAIAGIKRSCDRIQKTAARILGFFEVSEQQQGPKSP
jgi:antirestriction protein ArdC